MLRWSEGIVCNINNSHLAVSTLAILSVNWTLLMPRDETEKERDRERDGMEGKIDLMR